VGWHFKERKIAWIRWEELIKPNEKGVLGIRNIKKFNETLLAKWVWCLGEDGQEFWKQIIQSKYGVGGKMRMDSIISEALW